jgi:hypothetical protein
MDARKAEPDRCRQGEDRLVTLGIGRDLLRPGECRFDAAGVADTGGSAVTLDQSLMGFEYGLDRRIGCLGAHLASRRNVPS